MKLLSSHTLPTLMRSKLARMLEWSSSVRLSIHPNDIFSTEASNPYKDLRDS